MKACRLPHWEFAERARGQGFLWGVRGFYRPVFLVWGAPGLIAVLVATLVVLAPAGGFVFFIVRGGFYIELVWLVPITLAFLCGQPGLNCISALPWVLCAIVGAVLTAFLGGGWLLGGVLPGLTWFLHGALKGTTMQFMQGELCASQDAYRRLQDSDMLIMLGKPDDPSPSGDMNDIT